jgi:hypothetical protein
MTGCTGAAAATERKVGVRNNDQEGHQSDEMRLARLYPLIAIVPGVKHQSSMKEGSSP